MLALARTPLVDRFDLTKVETLHCGAAPLSVEVASAACKRLGVRISYGYGMTELSPLSHLTYSASDEDKPASAGYCLPNTTCKIVGTESRVELGPGEEGEVCVRGPQVMKGYLGQPQATAELIDNEGWLHTGDIGYADADGALYIVDRLKELIKYKGRQVAPAELEAVLLSHPAIADAAVLPSPDENAGEVSEAVPTKVEGADVQRDRRQAKVGKRSEACCVDGLQGLPHQCCAPHKAGKAKGKGSSTRNAKRSRSPFR